MGAASFSWLEVDLRGQAEAGVRPESDMATRAPQNTRLASSTAEAGKFSSLSSNTDSPRNLFHCPVFSGSLASANGWESHTAPVLVPQKGRTGQSLCLPLDLALTLVNSGGPCHSA